jgi:hypothetical protein|tara:strand:- start:122 stop:412 length:291 start_codon:yes stop_codon:yes gene_type:complete
VIRSDRIEGKKTFLDQALNLVTPSQQMGAVQSQLFGQVYRGNALGDSPKHQNNLGTPQTTPAPDASGEQVVDRAALSTPVVEDRRAMSIMRRLVGW